MELAAFVVAFGVLAFLAWGGLENVLKDRNDTKVKTQRLKTEEARELRRKAEIERGLTPSDEPEQRSFTEM